MEKRAKIHFLREEFEECVIECEEILRFGPFPKVKALKEKAKPKIPRKEKWYEVFGVPADSSKSIVKEAFRRLARLFSPNSMKNANLIAVDRKKINAKMAKINAAKTDFGPF